MFFSSSVLMVERLFVPCPHALMVRLCGNSVFSGDGDGGDGLHALMCMFGGCLVLPSACVCMFVCCGKLFFSLRSLMGKAGQASGSGGGGGGGGRG